VRQTPRWSKRDADPRSLSLGSALAARVEGPLGRSLRHTVPEGSVTGSGMVRSAVEAIAVTREAWRITLDDCHTAAPDSPASATVAASAVILGGHAAGCSDVLLALQFASVQKPSSPKLYDANFAFSNLPGYTGPPPVDYTQVDVNKRPRVTRTRSSVLEPLFTISLARLTAAIHGWHPPLLVAESRERN
jgi:hypothetical protein